MLNNSIQTEPKKFPEVFSDLLKKYKYTLYTLSEKSGIERTTLTKMQKGTRKLSLENFQKLISVMSLSIQDDELLRQAFIEYNFGIERYQTFHKIISFIQKADSCETGSPSVNVSLKFDDSILGLNSKGDVSTAIKSVIDEEFAKEDIQGRIFTNMDLFTMYDFIKAHPKSHNNEIDYKHIFEINKNQQSNSEILYNTINIMMLGYTVNYFTVDSCHTDNLINLFHYYIITKEIVLFADKDLQYGYAMKNSHLADIYAEKFNKIFARTTPFMENVEDILSLKGSILINCRSNYDFHANLGAFGNCVFYMDKEMWRQIAKLTVPNREFLISNTYEYYQSYYRRFEKLIAIMPRSELTRFVDYGIVMLMPKEYADPLTPSNRLRILTAFKEAILSGKESFYLVKDNVLNESKTNQIELFYSSKDDSTLMFINENKAKQMHFLGNNSIFCKEKNIVEEYKLFLEHMIISGDCYSGEESLKILEEEIDRCMLLGQ